jgi:hypothetical protein
MRYEVRWSNGFWKVFDTKFYCSVEVLGLREQAVKATQEWNANDE